MAPFQKKTKNTNGANCHRWKSCVKREVQSQVRHAIEDVSHLSCDRC